PNLICWINMKRPPTKDDICDFVANACRSKTNHTLYLGTVSFEVALKIKRYVPLTLTSYDIHIDEEHVRHIKNRHKEDLEYICLISEIITNFDCVFKSIEPNRRTKKTEVFLVFEKKYNEDVVKLVKLRTMKDKTLSLKTIFIKD
ncbi:MAG: hypothetical protein U9Q90_08275, partial [Campylobacterota bacterium]|nr:hypothetical protein [Campylobacterota bacterium]